MNKSCRIVLLFLALFANVHCDSSNSDKVETKSSGWIEAGPNQFPYLASIVLMSKYTCFGTIIHKYFILTTAQCIWNVLSLKRLSPDVIKIVVGNNINVVNSTGFPVKKIMVHEEYQYSIKTTSYNIALVQLEKPIEYNEGVTAIGIAEKTPEEGNEGWVSVYWNVTEGSQMVFKKAGIKLPVLGPQSCRIRGASNKAEFICMKKEEPEKGNCSKGSGSPLVVNDTLVGLGGSSFSCKGKSESELYTNVVGYNKWIMQKMNENDEE